MTTQPPMTADDLRSLVAATLSRSKGVEIDDPLSVFAMKRMVGPKTMLNRIEEAHACWMRLDAAWQFLEKFDLNKQTKKAISAGIHALIHATLKSAHVPTKTMAQLTTWFQDALTQEIQRAGSLAEGFPDVVRLLQKKPSDLVTGSGNAAGVVCSMVRTNVITAIVETQKKSDIERIMGALVAHNKAICREILQHCADRGLQSALRTNVSWFARQARWTTSQENMALWLTSVADTKFEFSVALDWSLPYGNEVVADLIDTAVNAAPGTLASAVSLRGWLDRAGLLSAEWSKSAQQKKPLSIEQKVWNGVMWLQAAKRLAPAYDSPQDMLVAVFSVDFTTHRGSVCAPSDFAHMGRDWDILAAALASDKPMRVLIVAPSGAGSSSALATALHQCGKTALCVEPSDLIDAADHIYATNALRQRASIIGSSIVAVDPAGPMLQHDQNSLLNNLTSSRQMPDMQPAEVWTITTIKGISQDILGQFDAVVTIPVMPLPQRQALAEKLFGDKILAHKIAQSCATPGSISALASWSAATGQTDWAQLSAKLAGQQQASIQAQEAAGTLPVAVHPPQPGTPGFDRVVAEDEVLVQARTLIAGLQDPERYRAMGAHVPKGLLLTGGPGMGKTHLARAMAGEAGVPLVEADSAAMAREPALISAVFAQARRQAPCILFLDEFDAVGASADGPGSPDPQRQAILNRLLTELDGFARLDQVLVIGATHRSDRLDPAVTRSGRLGWTIDMSPPRRALRETIWRLYAKKIKLADTIDWGRLARISAGMSPADIEHITNVAAMNAVMHNATCVGMSHLLAAADDVFWSGGPVDLKQRVQEKDRTAVHEAGHALMAWRMGQDIERVSIRPRNRALGHVRTVDAEDKTSHTQADVMGHIAVCFAGLCAETAVLGAHSTGASSDLEQARRWARLAVRAEGMVPGLPAGAPPQQTIAFVSTQLHAQVDDAEHTLLDDARSQTQEWMTANTKHIRDFADLLLKHGELESDEVSAWMIDRVDQVGDGASTLAQAARSVSGQAD